MKRLIATALVAALSLTSFAATPASALDQGERNRLVLGLGALAIIGALAGKGNSGGYVERNDNVWTPGRGDDWRGGRHDWRDDRYDRRDDRYGRRDRTLPSSCQFSIRTRNGVQSVLGKSCLAGNSRLGRLPDACEFNIRTSRGNRDVYGARCLEQNGYRIVASR
jgi:hypothetical protein